MATVASSSLLHRIGPPVPSIPPSTPGAGPSNGPNANQPSKKPKKRKRSLSPIRPLDECFTPWISLLKRDKSETLEERLHHEILAFAEWSKPTPLETKARERVTKAVNEVVQECFKSGTAELSMFGSSATGLCLPNGDIDLSISTPDLIVTEKIHPKTKNALHKLGARLRNSGVAESVQVIPWARIPIVGFKTKPQFGSINVDLGINNSDGSKGTQVVNSYLESMPALRPLILTVKSIMAQRKLNNAAHQGLGSYGIICMCIGFIKINPRSRPQEYIDHATESKSLGVLLMDFLLYFGVDFPYSTSYLSPAQGQVLPKEGAEWVSTSNPESLAIQCLVNPENDVGRTAAKITEIRDVFKDCYATLLRLSADDPKLLGSLFGVSQETLDHRAGLESLGARPSSPRPVFIHPSQSDKSRQDAARGPASRRGVSPYYRDGPGPPAAKRGTGRDHEYDTGPGRMRHIERGNHRGMGMGMGRNYNNQYHYGGHAQRGPVYGQDYGYGLREEYYGGREHRR